MADFIKKLTPYIKRSEDWKKFPAISFYCKLYVVERIMKGIANNSIDKSEIRDFLENLMIDLEQNKSLFPEGYLADDGDGPQQAMQFTKEMFEEAMQEESRLANLGGGQQEERNSLAAKFYLSSIAIDVISQFYQDSVLPQSLKSNQEHCRKKIVEFRKPPQNTLVPVLAKQSEVEEDEGFHVTKTNNTDDHRALVGVKKDLAHAISAIDFDDIQTAHSLIRKALDDLTKLMNSAM